MTNAVKPNEINHHNVAKVLVKILTNWDISTEDSAHLMGLSSDDLTSLLNEDSKINQATQERMGYLLNIHEQLKNLFGNDDNLPIFINTPNQAELFSGQVPLDYMKEQGLDGLKLVLEHLENARIK